MRASLRTLSFGFLAITAIPGVALASERARHQDNAASPSAAEVQQAPEVATDAAPVFTDANLPQQAPAGEDAIALLGDEDALVVSQQDDCTAPMSETSSSGALSPSLTGTESETAMQIGVPMQDANPSPGGFGAEIGQVRPASAAQPAPPVGVPTGDDGLAAPAGNQ